MKINKSTQYETIKLASQKPQNHGAKSTQASDQPSQVVDEKPFVDI